MAATDTTTANLTDGTYSIDILYDKLEHDYGKQIMILSIPKETDAKNKSPITNVLNPLNLNIDLKQLKQVITITGYLLEETGSSGLAKRDQLEAMMSYARSITLTWKTSTQTGTTLITKYGNIVKCKVTELQGRVGDEYSENQAIVHGKYFTIMIQFAVGTHRGA